MVIKLSKRISTAKLQKSRGGDAVLAGWVQDIRELSKINFIILRDREGTAQLVVKKLPKGLTRESVIAVKGKVKKSKSKQYKKELDVKKIDVLSTAAKPLPIEFLKDDIDTGLDKRLDYRWVDLRNPKRLLIFKVMTEFLRASREFFLKEGLLEIMSPKLIKQPSEGGGEEFAIPYFGRKAYLAQSPQFYKQMAQAAGFGGVFEIAPVFRANPSHTSRHDTEFTSLDVEISWMDHNDLVKFEERWLKHTISAIKKRYGKAIKKHFGVTIKVPKIPFPRVTMAEAHKIVGNKDKNTDLDAKGEKKISEYIKKKHNHDFVFITEFPYAVRPFYHMKPKGKPKLTKSYDLEYKGIEITTGAQREHRYKILKKQAKEKKLSTKKMKFYLDFFKWGCPPHSGFGLSPTRVVMLLLGLNNVRETTFVPRDPERLTP